MKIRFKIGTAGYDGKDSFVYWGGQVVDLPSVEAERWIRAGLAVAVDPPQPEPAPDLLAAFEPPEERGVETAEALPAPEVAVTRRGKPRKI